jgi:hypothetical protein
MLIAMWRTVLAGRGPTNVEFWTTFGMVFVSVVLAFADAVAPEMRRTLAHQWPQLEKFLDNFISK